MNHLQALTLSRLSEGKPKPVERKQITALEMVQKIYAMNANEGRDLILRLTQTDYLKKYIHSDTFILAEIPVSKVAAPVNRGTDLTLVSRLIAEAEKPVPIVVDFNFKKIGKTARGFYPQIHLVDGIERLEARARRGEPRILAWVGCEVSDEFKITLQADHDLSADEIQTQLQDLIMTDIGYKSGGMNEVGMQYPWIEKLYPMEDYCIYTVGRKKYRQRYTIEDKVVSLDGKATEVLKEENYVDASKTGRDSLESAMKRSSTTAIKTCKACGMKMSACTCGETHASGRETESEGSLKLHAARSSFHCTCDGCEPKNYCRRGIHGGGPGSGCTGDLCGRPKGPGHPDDHTVGTAVAKKFERYEKMVKAVADKKITGLAVFGERGIGKSKTVIDTLEKAGVEPVKIKGQITPLELYNTLAANRNEDDVVWFDDADSAFKDTSSLNILKAALDSDEPRVVSWLSTSGKVDEPSFRFKGRIIITTNINLDKNEHVAALVDRMHWINLKLNADEKMHRIEQVAPKMLSNLDKKTADEVVKWVKDNKDKIGDNLSLRVVKKVGDLATIDPDPKEWKELAKSFIDETNKLAPATTRNETSEKPLKEGRPNKDTSATPKGPYPRGSARQLVHDMLKDGQPHSVKEMQKALGSKGDKLHQALGIITKHGEKNEEWKITNKDGMVKMKQL